MNRRAFLASTTGLLPLSLGAAQRLPIKKAVLISMLPASMSFKDRFQLARDCGFEEIECQTVADTATASEIRQAAETTGLRIHSVMNMDHWRYPLSSSDPEVVAKCVSGMETSLRNANEWGAQTVLLVPAVVDSKTSYGD